MHPQPHAAGHGVDPAAAACGRGLCWCGATHTTRMRRCRPAQRYRWCVAATELLQHRRSACILCIWLNSLQQWLVQAAAAAAASAAPAAAAPCTATTTTPPSRLNPGGWRRLCQQYLLCDDCRACSGKLMAAGVAGCSAVKRDGWSVRECGSRARMGHSERHIMTRCVC